MKQLIPEIRQKIKNYVLYGLIILAISGIYAWLIFLTNNQNQGAEQRFGVVTSTGNFPTSLNNFQDNDIINAGDWNHIEYAIGETGTTSSATLTYQVTNTNANNLTYSGRLTITNASTTNFSVPSSGSFNLNATGTMQGFSFCTSGNGACGTSLTIGGSDTQVQFNDGGVLAGNSAFTFNKTGTKLVATNASFTNATSSSSLFIPFASVLSLTAQGQVGINTTQASSSLKFFDGTATRALYDVVERTITIASSTLAAGSGSTGTTTIPLGVAIRAQTWTKISCWTDTGTVNIKFGDTSNYMTMMALSTTINNLTTASNNTFTYLEKRDLQIGSASSFNYATCSASYRQDSD